MVSTFRYDLMTLRDAGTVVDRQVLSNTVAKYRSVARFPDLLENVAALAHSRRGVW